MTINQFAILVTKAEGKKKQISIAQVSEVLRVVNDLTGGLLYLIIKCKWTPKDKCNCC